MGLFIIKSFVFPLCFLGHTVSQNVVPKNPVEAYLGENTTLKILVENEQTSIIYWQFKNEQKRQHVATLRHGRSNVEDFYTGRASVDLATGYLTLTSVKLEDSGTYEVTIMNDYSTLTGIVKLHVLDVRRPELTLPAPTIEELQQEWLTLTCSAINGLPSNWHLHWDVNTSNKIDWEEEWEFGMLQDDELYSWSNSMMITMDNWKKIISVTCRARLGSLPPVTVTLKINNSSEAQPDSQD